MLLAEFLLKKDSDLPVGVIDDMGMEWKLANTVH